MDSTILFKTVNKNHYMYDIRHSILFNSHPILESIYSYVKEEGKEGNEIELILTHDYPDYSLDEIKYYIKKFHFLSGSDMFDKISTGEIIFGGVAPETIEKDVNNIDNILFQVTGNCNLSCKYCCYGDMYIDDSSQKPMTREIINKIFEFMLPKWESSANLSYNNPIVIGFYGGEPLLNFSLISYIMSCCKKLETKKLRFVYSMTTNALLLDKYMKTLADNDVSLLISLDGNKTHNQLRVDKKGKESFERIYRNIKLLQTTYPEYFERKVKFNSVLSKYSNAMEVHDFIKNEFGKFPLMDSISPHMLDEEKSNEFNDLYQPYIEPQELTKEKGTQSSVFKRLSMFFYYQLNNSYKHYTDIIYGKAQTQRKLPTGTCLPFQIKMFITADGQILACERIGLQYVLGTITDRVNINYNNIAELYTRYFSHIQKQCSNCYSISSCSQCLFQLPLKEDGLHLCPYMHGKKEYQIYLADMFGKLEEMPELFTNINKMIKA